MNRRINSLKISAKAAREATCRAVAFGRRRVWFPDGNGAVEFARPDLAEISSPKAADSFPALMPLGQFLFEYLYRCGVRHSFGIPGDFALPTFTWLEKSKIQNITMTHEPSAGFAADAYSRINGIGLVCVTYCVGGLNVLNAIRIS